ncbi:TerD family protein [Caldichromatium japonicum]|uniref:TerD family protein n=1 Tax=Caldichromatium japonicum TaxID=2699430 RepID=UPI001B354F35|nr:TerD family protein [Caldichromatium japonicum]
MTFYNQPQTPCGGVSLAAPAGFDGGFRLALDRLPAGIERLVLVAAIDGPGTMRQLTQSRLALVAEGREQLVFPFQGSDFAEERALILAEIYRKEGPGASAQPARGLTAGSMPWCAILGGSQP